MQNEIENSIQSRFSLGHVNQKGQKIITEGIPVENLLTIILDQNNPIKTSKLGTLLSEEQKIFLPTLFYWQYRHVCLAARGYVSNRPKRLVPLAQY